MAHQTPRLSQKLLWLPFSISRQQIKRCHHITQPKPFQGPSSILWVANSNDMESRPQALLKAPPVSFYPMLRWQLIWMGLPRSNPGSIICRHLREWGWFLRVSSRLQLKVQGLCWGAPPGSASKYRANAEGLLQVPTQRTGLMLRGSPNRFSNDEVESNSPPVFTWK